MELREHCQYTCRAHLAGSRYPYGPRPVVVHVCHLVRQPLHVVRFQSRVVTDHYIVGGSDSALTHMLTHKEEVVPANRRAMRDTYTYTEKSLAVCS